MAANYRKSEGKEDGGTYRTKVIQFFGRSVPIILQNDNGPCPLIAICNVLLLRNTISIGQDTSEISLTKLLSLVGERLLDSNTTQDKDVGYAENQQQNIHDAIEMLPRLATGIDVNLHFSKIDDFEFTPERAIFDLLGIELYHGWIVDPQDIETSKAIGSKSYNTLIAEIVSLEDISNSKGEKQLAQDETFIDFAAATAAVLGVPAPSVSSSRYFDDSVDLDAGKQEHGKGDREEEEELLRVLRLSENETLSPSDEPNKGTFSGSTSTSTAAYLEAPATNEYQSFQCPDMCTCTDSIPVESPVNKTEIAIPDIVLGKVTDMQDTSKYSKETNSNHLKSAKDAESPDQSAPLLIPDEDACSVRIIYKNDKQTYSGIEPAMTSLSHIQAAKDCDGDLAVCPATVPFEAGIEGWSHSGLEKSEPLYEGEECIFKNCDPVYGCREPIYEGEVLLAENTKLTTEVSDTCPEACSEDRITIRPTKADGRINVKEGELIRNFLKNNASQLTVYGLFCLQEGLKERELCVFFRNNHFSTMFKFKGELYLLATDQGYINQPNLVWEKLNEVNGDTVFMMANFLEFNAKDDSNAKWNEQNAVSSTADYLASIEGVTRHDLKEPALSSDLQLAIALQQQEFEQQPHCSNQHAQQSSAASGTSKLVTGPQGSKSSYTRHDTRSKCIVM